MAQVMTRRSFAKRSDLDLMMECEDDDLSPAQRELFQTQLAEQRKYDAQVAKYNAEKAKQDQQVQILQQHHTVHSFSEMPRMVPNISMKGSNMRVTNQRTMLKTMLANKPSNIKTVTNASSIVQTIAKQIGTPTSGISPASNVGQSYILAPNSRTPIHLQAQGTSMVQQPIAVPSQPMNTSASAPSTRYIIQKSTPTVSLLSSQPLHSLAQTQPVNNSTQYQRYPAAQMQTIPQQSIINTNYGASLNPNYSTTANQSPRQQIVNVSVPTSTASNNLSGSPKNNLKTTVIRVPTGVNIQQHLGQNYKLLTSAGNVYHYVYSPATNTLVQPGVKVTQMHNPVQTAPPKNHPPSTSTSLPREVTDILLGKPPNRTKPTFPQSSQRDKVPMYIPGKFDTKRKSKTSELVPQLPEREERHRYTIQQFYGTKEGSRNYQDERFKNGFKCYHCTKTINNNIKFMQHIKNHLEKEKQENLSLSDIINCEHCGRRFNTPFELQCHIEKAHLNTSNLKCKICDMVYESRLNLQCHLNTKHPPLQMPYHCPVCNFRSSVHDDIIEHFRCKHEGIRQLLCTHCLKGVRDGTSYLRHCQKHQTKSGNSRCKQCKLMFLTPAELKTHMKEDHIRFPVKKVSESVKSQEQIIQESAEQKRVLKRASVDSFDIYKKQKKQMRGDARKGTLESYSLLDWKASLDKTRKIDDNGMVHKCSECSTAIDDLAAHFATFLKCSSCPYRTYCGMSYGNHMIKFHKSNRPAPKLHPVTKPSIDILKCEKCNYCTESGSAMAGHVMTCTMGPTEVEGFKHHTRPRRPEEYAQSSCSSNSPGTKWMESPEPSQYQDDGFFDDVVKDDASVTDAVSNIIDRLFGTDDEPPSQNPVDDANIMAEPSIPSTSAQETKVNDDDDDDIILLDDDEPEIEKTSKPEKKTIPAEPATVLEEESPVVEDDKEGAAEDALLESHPAEEEGGLEDNSLSKEEEDKLLEDEEDELVTEDAKADVGDTLTDGTDGVAVAEHCQDEQDSPDKPTKEDFGSSENKSDGAGSEEDAKDVHAVGSGDPLESKDEDVVMATNDSGDSESVDLLGNPSVEDNTMEVDA